MFGIVHFLRAFTLYFTDHHSMNHSPSPSKGQHITQISIVAADESDTELSDREVKPKFVVGTKKYGRRSRPVSSDDILSGDDESDEASSGNNKQDETYYVSSGSNSQANDDANSARSKVQRSASQSDIHGTKRKRPMSASRLKRCASLPPQRSHIPRRVTKDKLTGKIFSC